MDAICQQMEHERETNFPSKKYYVKGKGVWRRGRASPYKDFEYPSPHPRPLVFKGHRPILAGTVTKK